MERPNARMRYTVEQGEALAQKLRAMPPIEKSKQDLSRLELVKMLRGEIRELQTQGYSIERIAEVLRAEGVDISPPTLKNYIQKARSESTEGTPKRKTRGNVRKKPRETVSGGAVSKETSTREEIPRVENASKTIGSLQEAAIARQERHAVAKPVIDPEKATFTPRPDRQKI